MENNPTPSDLATPDPATPDPITVDPTTADPTAVCLKLRDDLSFQPQMVAGARLIFVEDPVTSKHHRLGMTEYQFVSLLDGRTSVADAREKLLADNPDLTFSETDAISICNWLIQNELAYTDATIQSDRLAALGQAKKNGWQWAQSNLLFIRIPLLVPDRLIGALYPWLRRLHSPATFLAVLPMAVWALWLAINHWDRLLTSAHGIFEPDQRFILLASWIGLKVLHELSHGLACKRYGGYVREAGVVLVVLTPVAYVDVTSSWKFPSKWQRIHVAVAGMYLELIIASAAMIAWNFLDSGPWSRFCIHLMLAGSINTVLFNANPLMRFDGYYILSDLLEIPNLYTDGQQYVRSLGMRIFFGIRTTPSRRHRSRTPLVKIYGIAAFFWRIVVCVGLVVAAAAIFHGAGLVLAALAVVFWVLMPAARLVQYLIRPPKPSRPSRLRFLLVFAGLLALAYLALWVPWPGKNKAPAIVEYSPLTVVRAQSPGFIREILVHDGQAVEPGEVLAVLENRELALELASLELSLEQSEIRGRQLHGQRDMSAWQSELKQREAIEKRLAQKSERVSTLTIRAPAGGRVVARNLDTLVGSYLAEGNVLCFVGRESAKEVRVSIHQNDVDAFVLRIGEPIQIRAPGASFQSVLDRVDPKARTVPLHEALIAPNGGPIPVKTLSPETGLEIAPDSVELLKPRFTGTVLVPTDESLLLACGQRCVVSFGGQRKSIGTVISQYVEDWLRKRSQR